MVLACTDGSIYSPSVYDHALWAARSLEAGIHVLHMIPPATDPMALHNFSGSIGLDARQKLREELVKLEEAKGRVAHAKSSAILEEARNHLQKAEFIDFQVEAQHGHLAETIEENNRGATLVVIGKRGESADFERLHLGANIERIIRSCPQPVLVAARAFTPVKKSVIAFDGGPSSQRAVSFVAKSALFKDQEIHLLTVGKPHAEVISLQKDAIDLLRSHSRLVTSHHLPGQPEDVLTRFVSEHQINLLVMGAYGHSRIRQLIVGSTTTTMVRTCRIPVLMFR